MSNIIMVNHFKILSVFWFVFDLQIIFRFINFHFKSGVVFKINEIKTNILYKYIYYLSLNLEKHEKSGNNHNGNLAIMKFIFSLKINLPNLLGKYSIFYLPCICTHKNSLDYDSFVF